MPTVEDVSPTLSNASLESPTQFPSGRMLSLASSDDGMLVFAGSLSSDIWVSEDGGASFEQITWPQPAAGQFGVPGAIGGYCVVSIAVAPDSARWLVERSPRFLADITGDGRADIVGFGESGVWTALSNGDGTFAEPRVVLADFGIEAGGWRVDRHPRFLADITGDGRADIIGFGDAGVYVALSNGDGTFAAPQFVLNDLGYEAGGWRIDKHPRLLADITGDGRADIVGFGNAGVYIARSNGDGSFQYQPQPVVGDFGLDAGGWQVDRHPRFLADITGDGRADIVGFGDAGVYVALSLGNGAFTPVQFVIADLGYDAGGWRTDKHPRVLADITGEGRADIVGFGNAGVYVARSNGDGSFQYQPQPVLGDFGLDAGGWQVDKHPRFLADITGDGRADIVGFGDAGVYVALSTGNGTFADVQFVIPDFGYDAGGWRTDKHPRVLADITGDGRADIVGFGDAGVYDAISTRRGAFAGPRFVLANFGDEAIVLAIVRDDRESDDAGVWRSTDRGRTWTRVHAFPQPPGSGALTSAGELAWAPGSATMVYAAGGSSLAVSRDAGATFTDVLPTRRGGFERVNHVAAAATPPGTLVPPVVYALGDSRMFVSFDGGQTWILDESTSIPSAIGGAVGLANAQGAKVLAVSPRSPLEVFVTANANIEPALFRGDFDQFLGTHSSAWEAVPLPPIGMQFSGNVFVEATRPGHGDVVFYSPQRAQTWVAPLDPTDASDWEPLDPDVSIHPDLHGIFLSPDFEATFEDGRYKHVKGNIWATSDGGVHWSRDGGKTFRASENVATLSCVNVAGVALIGKGPVLSLNTGDNDGFTSSNGGDSWRSQQYGGGDNDCSFADPMRAHSMLVFTPRWDVHGHAVPASLGNTVALYEADPGDLPDVGSGTDMRHMVPGPPLRTKSTIWNASSGFALRGFRPIVLRSSDDEPHVWPWEDRDEPGHYIFIRFFGNTVVDNVRIPNNLAVLLRTHRLREITHRSDWDTPGGWRVDQHPRFLADITGDGRADIVGFGDAGVWTALSKPDGTFADPRFVLADFGIEAGGWRVDRHPRFLADITGDGRADIVGFGDAGVYVALSNGDGTFAAPQFVLADLGYEAGGWRTDQHPRFLADITGDGRADIVGFGDAGVYVALSNGDGSFEFVPVPVLDDFGLDAGGWRVDKHPRFLADITGDGRADIVGFGDAGVYVARSKGNGTFNDVQFVLDDLGYEAGGWRTDKHPRLLADITGDGRADIVGFGDAGVYVALSNGDGSFQYQPQPVLDDFGLDAGGWRVDRHPRLMADITGEGRADIVGFGDAGVYVALSNGDGSFTPVQFVLADLGYEAGGWRTDQHPRLLADITGDGRADIVGFGDAGVYDATSTGTGTFRQPLMFVIPNFGAGDGGFVEQQGPFLPSPDAGIVQAWGGHEHTGYVLGGDPQKRLWHWQPGMESWEQLVPGTGPRTARRFFVHPYIEFVIYVLDSDHVWRYDPLFLPAWQIDTTLEEALTCGGRIPIARDEDADGQGDHLDLILTDMCFDPFQSDRRFAVGIGGAFMTDDGGQTWERLLDTGALRGRPTNCYYDYISAGWSAPEGSNVGLPSDPTLYVSFAGRSIVKISGLTYPSGVNGGSGPS